jgi:hypothetical protein
MSKIIKFSDAISKVEEQTTIKKYENDIAILKEQLLEINIKYLSEKAKNDMIHLYGLETYNNLTKVKTLLENSLVAVDGILKIIENN